MHGTRALLFAVVGLLVCGVAIAADASEARSIVEAQCAACHNLRSSDKATLQERAEMVAPPLHYAGNKYRKEWLATWLQKPRQIWPAGVFFGAHVKTTPKGDEIDETTLKSHMVLPAEQANAVAEALMTYTSKSRLIAGAPYKSMTISKRLGMLNFGKFKGCASCHSDEEGYGGVSGPELYTAFSRLKPEYLVSFTQNPQAWLPNSLMPNQHLKDEEVGKLVAYLKLLTESKQ